MRIRPVPHTRPGFRRLIGPMAQTHGLQGLCPLRYAPCRIRGPGLRPAYWPMAQTHGLQGCLLRPVRIRGPLPAPIRGPGGYARRGLLGRWPKRTASRGFAPLRAAAGRLIGPMAQTHGLQGLCPLAHTPRAAYAARGSAGYWADGPTHGLQGFAPCCYAPCRIRGPGFRPAYWANGPNARPPGASPPCAPARAACGQKRINKGPGFREKSGALAAPARQSNWTERSALPVMAFWRHLPRRKK